MRKGPPTHRPIRASASLSPNTVARLRNRREASRGNMRPIPCTPLQRSTSTRTGVRAVTEAMRGALRTRAISPSSSPGPLRTRVSKLPRSSRQRSRRAQGVEVPSDYAGEVPEGFEIIDLPPCKMMVFQGPPFDDEDFEQAIGNLWEVMKSYNPELYGFAWADEDGPRFQLEPWGYRGYIEARPVRQLNVK